MNWLFVANCALLIVAVLAVAGVIGWAAGKIDALDTEEQMNTPFPTPVPTPAPTAPAKNSALKKYWLPILASMFTGAEAVVSAGVALPGSDHIPIGVRVVVYLVVMGGGFFLRWYLTRPKDE